MITSEYNKDQLTAIQTVRVHLKGHMPEGLDDLEEEISAYLQFRRDVAAFQKIHLWDICTSKCFTSQVSACCNREGIATFFGDVVVNALFSSPKELDALEKALANDKGGFKCVYLTDTGCAWHLKPIVCEMFLCDHAKEMLSKKQESLIEEWEGLRNRERQYTWPDKPVLFDGLEDVFIRAGLYSPLMYFHKSPGLLRIKNKSKEACFSRRWERGRC